MSSDKEQTTLRIGIIGAVIAVCAACFAGVQCSRIENETVRHALDKDKATLGRTWEGVPRVYIDTPTDDKKTIKSR